MYKTYDEWFRAKVIEALNSTYPNLPHGEVMKNLRRICAK